MESPFRPYQGDEPFVFICYAHDDDEVVYPELVRLREQGVNIWYDEGISPGAEWSDVLADRIKNCSAFLYYVSPRSVASEHCRQELLFAQEGSCEILAVHLEQTDLSDGMRLRLGHRQAVMRYEQSSEMYEEKLLEALRQAQTGVRTLDETPTRSTPAASRRTGVLAGAGALIVAVVALVWYLNPIAPSAIDSSPSILVLPFENLSPLEENAFFAAGLHEDILTHLSQIQELTVISRTSSIALAKTGKTIPEMAAQVGVAHVLEGSVRRDTDRVKITVQLIEAASDRRFWAQSYDRQLTDIFDVQREIAEEISSQLELRLDAELVARFAQAPTDNLEAYDLFLRARELTYEETMVGFDEAIELLERAVDLDPGFADAWALLGLTVHFQAALSRTREKREIALAKLERAYSLDPDSPTVLSQFGYVLTNADNRERMEEAQAYLERALALAPNDADVHHFYGMNIIRRFQLGIISRAKGLEALEQLEEAVRLDPLGQPYARFYLVATLSAAGRLDEALAFAEESLEIHPEHPRLHNLMSIMQLGRGNVFEGLNHAQRAAALTGPTNVSLGNSLVSNLAIYEEFDAALDWLDWQQQHHDSTPLALVRLRAETLVDAGKWQDLIALSRETAAGTLPTSGNLFPFDGGATAAVTLHPSRLAAEASFIRAQEARTQGNMDAFRTDLSEALEAFHQLDEEIPLGERTTFCVDFEIMMRYLVAARQAEQRELADALLRRINACAVEFNGPAPRGARTWYAYQAMWAALNGHIDDALQSIEQQTCCALAATKLRANGVLGDLGGAFHGFANQPRFKALLEERNRQVEELHRRIRSEAPWILKPPS